MSEFCKITLILNFRCFPLRYIGALRDGINQEPGEKAVKNLDGVALSCHLNIAACKLKLCDWDGAIQRCDEVCVHIFILYPCVMVLL